MNVRRCSKCSESKHGSDFYTHGNGKPAGWCKSCRCENERTRRTDKALVSKFHTKYETDMDFRARELLRAVQKRCRKTGTEYGLEVAWMAHKLRGRCELTGLPFDMSVRSRKPSLYTPSIDRIEPGQGYTKDNCRLVLFAVNLWLKDFTIQALVPIADALVRHQTKAEAA